jgi:hypothetical protein
MEVGGGQLQTPIGVGADSERPKRPIAGLLQRGPVRPVAVGVFCQRCQTVKSSRTTAMVTSRDQGSVARHARPPGPGRRQRPRGARPCCMPALVRRWTTLLRRACQGREVQPGLLAMPDGRGTPLERCEHDLQAAVVVLVHRQGKTCQFGHHWPLSPVMARVLSRCGPEGPPRGGSDAIPRSPVRRAGERPKAAGERLPGGALIRWNEAIRPPEHNRRSVQR